jgi:RNA polymerase sigma-70 factor (ECF subfamily)
MTSTIVPALDASDETLAARAAAGDDRAFEILVERHRAPIYRLACRLTSDTDAPDVLQDTFLQVYRNLAAFRHESQFRTWLYRIATNSALMLRRARRRHPAESLDSYLPRYDERGEHAGTPAELQIVARTDDLLDRQLLAAKARTALQQLPDRYRDPFVLRDLEEMSTAEVARVLGIEPAAVRQRVHRARLMLRGYLSALIGGTP